MVVKQKFFLYGMGVVQALIIALFFQ